MMTPRSGESERPIGSLFAIRSAASRSTLNVPIRLTPITFLNPSSGNGPSLESVLMALPMPAQLTLMRKVPSDSATSSALPTAASSVTSASTKRARSPSPATASSPRRSTTTTCAPASSNRLVVASPRPEAPPVTTATASLISMRVLPILQTCANQPVGWGLYPAREDGFDVGRRVRRPGRVRCGAGKPRSGPRLQAPVDFVERVALGDVRLALHLAEGQHRCDARVGVGEHLGPVVTILTAEPLREHGPQFWPARHVVLVRQVGAVQTQAGQHGRIELRLHGADPDVAPGGEFVGGGGGGPP